jgi:penicillin-binding protein 1A
MSDDAETPLQVTRAGDEPRRARATAGRRRRLAAAGVVQAPAPAVTPPALPVPDHPEVPIEPGASGPLIPPEPPRNGGGGGGGGSGGEGRPPRPRLRKLRLLGIILGLAALAIVSTIFGMMMAVASDIPQLENRQQYKLAKNSYLYDDHWRPIGIFAPPDHVVIDNYDQISPAMRDAIIAIEDKRFMSDPGVDIRGVGRAFIADVTGGSTQGASTITEQFVKNALQAQNNRTVFEKLREAALAYHLTRRWSKRKILTEYLNSIYFGNGAYGVESAARVYFGKVHGYDSQAGPGESRCGDSTPGLDLPKCAKVLAPWEAALLAGMVANPSAFNPFEHPHAALLRRNLVLRDMLDQGYISTQQYKYGAAQPMPTVNDLQQPAEPPAAPYFTSWLRPQILAALGHGVTPKVAEYRAFYGGLKIRTTLDLKLQQAADQAIASELPYGAGQPTVSLVSIDNKTGEVRAMVGGPVVSDSSGSLYEDYAHHPFNIATEGLRQPGSSFKPFTLAIALESGFGPDSEFVSAPADFIVPNSGGKEHFIVHNFGNTYSGVTTLQSATDFSDNSVYARLGLQALGRTGTRRVANLAMKMGIRTHVSNNPAMILGAMKAGVTPLDMAHAYETFATGGNRVFSPTLGAPDKGPTGVAQINCPVCHHHVITDQPTYKRVLPASIAKEVHGMLTGVVQSGTGTQAGISGADVVGKTGTTSNYADAWFVGWTPQLTTAVWVGFPDKLVPMGTLYNGGPVEGGTFPAIIWHDYMSEALQILASEQPAPKGPTTGNSGNSGAGSGVVGGSGAAPQSGSSGGAVGNSGAGAGGGGAATPAGGGGGAAGNSGAGGAGGGGGGAGNSGAGGGNAGGTGNSGGAGNSGAGGGGAGNTGAGGGGGGAGNSGGSGGAGVGGGTG